MGPASGSRDVQGVTARAIDVVIETGDSGPDDADRDQPPERSAIREGYGSKSVSLSNVIEAYDRSLPERYPAEFSWTTEEAERAERWGSLAGELSTNMHEVIGHGSGHGGGAAGRRAAGVAASEHYSALEETRADLVALYFVADPKMVELGLLPADALETSSGPSTRRTRATRSCSCAACARAPGSRKITCATARRSCTG